MPKYWNFEELGYVVLEHNTYLPVQVKNSLPFKQIEMPEIPVHRYNSPANMSSMAQVSSAGHLFLNVLTAVQQNSLS